MVVDKIFHTCPPPSLFPSLSPSLLPPSHPKEKIIRKKREPTLYSLEFFFLTVMNCFFCWFKKERCGTVSMRLLFVFFFSYNALYTGLETDYEQFVRLICRRQARTFKMNLSLGVRKKS